MTTTPEPPRDPELDDNGDTDPARQNPDEVRTSDDDEQPQLPDSSNTDGDGQQ
jgi:hypothetical protein